MTLVVRNQALRVAVVALAKGSGLFASVNGAETGRAGARSANLRPHAMVVLGQGRAAPDKSSLNTTGWRQVVIVRMEHPLALDDNREQARVEDAMATAADSMVDLAHANIDVLDDDSTEFDPVGSAGLVLGIDPGYVQRDQMHMRVADVNLPYVLWDVWTQQR